jgi:hypothetical protein
MLKPKPPWEQIIICGLSPFIFLRFKLYRICGFYSKENSLFTRSIPMYTRFISCKLVNSLTHSWSWALLEKLPIVQLLKNFPAFYGTRRFITAFTRALHWSLSRARSIQPIPSHHISLRPILILSWSPQWSLSFWISHQHPICIPFLPHSYYMPRPKIVKYKKKCRSPHAYKFERFSMH